MEAVKESDVQAAIRDLLTSLGYMVRQTSVRGWRGTKGYGTDKGIPDLLVTRPGWFCTCEIEVKGPKTKLSPEQDALVKSGVMSLARTVEDAMVILRVFERRHDLDGYCSRTWKGEA